MAALVLVLLLVLLLLLIGLQAMPWSRQLIGIGTALPDGLAVSAASAMLAASLVWLELVRQIGWKPLVEARLGR